jgi:PKD repeat protein
MSRIRPRLSALLLVAAMALPASTPVLAESPEPLPGHEGAEELIEDSGADVPGEGLLVGIPGATQPGGSSPSIGGSPMTFFHYPAPASFSFANDAGETSIGVNLATNNAMFLMALNTARVHWDDAQVPPKATWEDVSFPTTAAASIDPYLWTDQDTGRTFVLQLAGAESAGAFTDDDGANWVPMGNAGVPPSFDHQKLGGGAYHAPLPAHPPSPAYADNLYYCAQQGVTNGDRNGLAQCARSDDGGLTFGPPLYMDLLDCFPIHDQPNVGPDGSVYISVRGCGALSSGKPLGVLLSRDNGVTWQNSTIPGTLMSTYNGGSGFEFGSPTDVAFDAAGKMYFVGATGVFSGTVQTAKTPFVATSTNGAATWSAPFNIGASVGVQNAEMAAIVAGDAGRAAAMFYGSTTGGNDQVSSFVGQWHLYVSYTFDGGATWSTIDTTPNDPVQRGCIWNRGGSSACRNLLDFEDVAVDKEGRVVVGYADGCISAKCVGGTGTPADSRDSYGKIARQTTGKRLFAAFDPPGGVDPLKVDAGGPYKGVEGSSTPLSGLAYGGTPGYTLGWDFDGDGTTDATGATVSMPAKPMGSYSVTLTATDSAGRTASDTATVLIRKVAAETAVRSFSFDRGSDCDAQGWTTSVGAEVRLIGVSAGGTQWHLTKDKPASAPCAWYNGDDTVKQYVESSATNLVSPGGAGCFFLPPNAQGARVAYNLAGASESGFDFLRFQARSGCDAGVFSDIGGPAVSGFVSSLPNYVSTSRSLDDLVNVFGGGPAQVRFRFASDESIDGVGFQVDDVQLLVKDGPPVLDPVGDRSSDDLHTMSFTLTATDPDLDPVTFGATGLPAGATLDAKTGAFSWKPGSDQAPGSFPVTFSATDGLFTDSETVTLTALNVPPAAAGSVDMTTTDRLTPVHFTDASTDSDGSVASWLWDFGDGTTSTEQNPTHTYARLGSKTVTLTVEDDDGDSSATETIGSVLVKNIPPRGGFARTSGDANRVDPVQFTDTSTDLDGAIASWAWDFGEGGGSAEQSPSHTYGALGTFPVTLTVTDSDGGSDTVGGTVTVVNLAPVPDFTTTPEHPLALVPTVFGDRSGDRDGSIASWAWDFGDGGTSSEQSPAHVYMKGGHYVATLTVTDNEGASGTLVRDVFVCMPGVDLAALLDLGHVRVEVEACVALSGGDLPV